MAASCWAPNPNTGTESYQVNASMDLERNPLIELKSVLKKSSPTRPESPRNQGKVHRKGRPTFIITVRNAAASWTDSVERQVTQQKRRVSFNEDVELYTFERDIPEPKQVEWVCFDCCFCYDSFRSYKAHIREFHMEESQWSDYEEDIIASEEVETKTEESEFKTTVDEAVMKEPEPIPIKDVSGKNTTTNAKVEKVTPQKPTTPTKKKAKVVSKLPNPPSPAKSIESTAKLLETGVKQFDQTSSLPSSPARQNRKRSADLPVGPPELKCYILDCGETFKTLFKAREHLREEHKEFPPNLVSCRTCGQLLPTKKELDGHIASAHPLSFQCSSCDRKFKTDEARKLHLRTAHGLRDVDNAQPALEKDKGQAFYLNRVFQAHFKSLKVQEKEDGKIGKQVLLT